MGPVLPGRYRLELRLDPDEDIEQWLATDTVLDRPVLVRALGPPATPERLTQFVAAARAAATVEHMHLARIYEAGESQAGAYMIGEWTQGISLADRVIAEEYIPNEEFLPNAAGLAGAVAAMHARGVLHGALDGSACEFSAARPAKLAHFGRIPRYGDPAAEVRALADTLASSMGGGPTHSLAEMVNGLHSSADEAIAKALQGELDASGLAAQLRASPSASTPPAQGGWSWGWLLPAVVAAGLALAVGTLARLAYQEDRPPFSVPPPSSTHQVTVTTRPPVSLVDSIAVLPVAVAVYDPFGGGSEHNDRLPSLVDGDLATAWRTERYFAPLQLIKPGVGVTFSLTSSTPATVLELVASPDTSFELRWAATAPADLDGWELITSASVGSEPVLLELPNREGGVWLLWLTALSFQDDVYYSQIFELRVSGQ